MDIIINHLAPWEFDDLLAFDTKVFGDGAYHPIGFRQLVDLFDQLLFVARREDRIVGYAMGGVSLKSQKGWMLALAVEQSMRHFGIGEELSKKLLIALQNEGVSEVLLTVDPSNAPAIGLYRKLGFSDLEISENYYGRGRKRLVMTLAALG